MIHVRDAVPGDVPLIAAMVRELAEHEGAPDRLVATESTLGEDLFGARSGTLRCVVGEVEGAALGIGLYFFNASTWVGRRGLYLEDLYVRPAARGKGLGRAILTRLAAVAGVEGCARLEWSVLRNNADARRFYESLGARPQEDFVLYRVVGDALARLGGGEGGVQR